MATGPGFFSEAAGLWDLCPWSLWSEWGLIGEMDERFVLEAEHRGLFQVHKDPLEAVDLEGILSDLREHLVQSLDASLPPRGLYDPDGESPASRSSDFPSSPSRLRDSEDDSLTALYYRALGYYFKRKAATPQVVNLPPVFRRLVRRGVPEVFREHLWLLLSGGRNALLSRSDYASLAKRVEESSHLNLIQLDISRTYTDNVFFQKSGGPFRSSRVLAAYSLRNRGLGYCQGLSYLSALLNTHCSEEVAFTLLCVILEDGLVPPDYYTNLTGAVVDQQVLETLMKEHTPGLFARLEEAASLEDFTVSSIPWFMCLFAATFDSTVAARLWDFLFLLGPCALFRCALGVLQRVERSAGDPRASLALNLKAVTTADVDAFMELFEALVTSEDIAALRERHRLEADRANASPCQLTVLLAACNPTGSVSASAAAAASGAEVNEEYFGSTPSAGAASAERRVSRRKRIVREIDAFLGR